MFNWPSKGKREDTALRRERIQEIQLIFYVPLTRNLGSRLSFVKSGCVRASPNETWFSILASTFFKKFYSKMNNLIWVSICVSWKIRLIWWVIRLEEMYCSFKVISNHQVISHPSGNFLSRWIRAHAVIAWSQCFYHPPQALVTSHLYMR